ncbi:hypothetical protein [Candidatus Hecatella orcuttiae]|jgi:hypothetical protein|uniref:hypothetical protein n=1 Tax=Candidatus Hecatella orcuttiae TaxID=1935119 RepID=UPI00286815B7|nr:hypothetical protein [Candidatus Hecatella orcuttiae]
MKYECTSYKRFIYDVCEQIGGCRLTVKLRFKVKGVFFECVGTPPEINEVIKRLVGGKYLVESLPSGGPPSPPEAEPSEEIDLKEKIPQQKNLILYITSKPNFEHNIFEIQERFFGQRFDSRGSQAKKYNALYRRLVRAREKIEEEYGGRFESRWVRGEGGELYKSFRFVREVETSKTASSQRLGKEGNPSSGVPFLPEKTLPLSSEKTSREVRSAV